MATCELYFAGTAVRYTVPGASVLDWCAKRKHLRSATYQADLIGAVIICDGEIWEWFE